MNHKSRILVRADADPERAVNEKHLAVLLPEALDPTFTVTALNDSQLAALSDALYSRLDTPNPAFGVHTWYDLVADEMQRRVPASVDGSDVTS